MKIIFVILFTILKLDGMISFSVNSGSSKVLIQGFRWPADAAAMQKIPDNKVLVFNNAKVDILPNYFANQFEKCIRIDFQYGTVKTIHINPKITHMEIRFSYTENLMIERETHYQLEKFLCIRTKLTYIPENINQLKKIRELDLSHNLIETVQLDQFDGLANLEKLGLSFNKIKRIASDGSISFPSLTDMQLEHNQLQHFDVCSWNMSSLHRLNLKHNNLTHFAINHFRSLHLLNMEDNPLNCAWKDSLLEDKRGRDILGKLTCDEKSVNIFGLDCSPSNKKIEERSPATIDQLQQEISNFDSKLANMEETNNKKLSDLSNRIEKIEALLENLVSKIIEQQNVSNDIIEAMYRIEIERASQNKKNK
ncbi:leucine-rich repeats and immunoglobulin-like domains protein 1 [Aedes albopictus]|uniref:Leucine-rich repeat protein n=1 Tax=Aedes albopictus TaxID=7160 RepID=A0ABM1ZAL3_AEDAL